MAAPKASVEEPANAATNRDASRLPKVLEEAPQMLHTNSSREAVMKTGLLPKYMAVGTQKKF